LVYWPVVDEQGRPVGVLGVCNTTAHVAMESRLRESAEQLHAFLAASTTSMYRMSPDWNELRQLDGQGFLSSTEKSRTDWLQTYIPADEQPRVLAAIEAAIRTRQPFDLEHRVNLAIGGFGWSHSKAVPMLNERGDIVEWFGTALEITERKRMEDALRASEERFRLLYEAQHTAHLVLAPDLTIEAVSEPYQQATLRREEELVGKYMFTAFPDNPDDPNASGVRNLAASLEWVKQHRRPHRMPVQKYDIRRPSGDFEVRWWSPLNIPVLGPDGAVRHIIHQVEDVTAVFLERQKAAEAQADAERMRAVAEVLRDREDFQKLLLHEISHRVKNSLAMVSALLDLQAKGLAGTMRHTIEDASVRVRTVATVHDQLWRQADARDIELAPFVSNLAAAVATGAPHHHTIVEVEPAIVSADAAVPIGLLINELVTNAYKHAYPPGSEGEVRIAGRRTREQRYELAVADAGRGLPSDFDSRKSRGSLGMRVVNSLAAQLKGTLTVSPAHPGARFIVEFPIKASTSAHPNE